MNFSEERMNTFNNLEKRLNYLLKYMRLSSITNQRSNPVNQYLKGCHWVKVPGEALPMYLSRKWRLRLYRELGAPLHEVGAGSEQVWF